MYVRAVNQTSYPAITLVLEDDFSPVEIISEKMIQTPNEIFLLTALDHRAHPFLSLRIAPVANARKLMIRNQNICFLET